MTISEQQKRIGELTSEKDRRGAEIAGLNLRLTEAVTAKEQADAVINRQGEKITTLQNIAADLERKICGQSCRLAMWTGCWMATLTR